MNKKMHHIYTNKSNNYIKSNNCYKIPASPINVTTIYGTIVLVEAFSIEEENGWSTTSRVEVGGVGGGGWSTLWGETSSGWGEGGGGGVVPVEAPP